MTKQSANADPQTLRILQWNVWYRANPKAIGEHLLRLTDQLGVPDVLCVQEVTEPVLDILADAVDARSVSYFATRTHKGGMREGQAVIATSLPTTPSGTIDSFIVSRGGRAPFKGGSTSVRVAQIGRFAAAPDIAVANLHTSYPTLYSPIFRWRERKALDALFEGCESTVAVGDLNSGPGSHVVSVLAKHMELAKVTGPTWTSAHMDGGHGYMRRVIDYAFATPDLDIHVVQLPAGPSDHAPRLVSVNTASGTDPF